MTAHGLESDAEAQAAAGASSTASYPIRSRRSVVAALHHPLKQDDLFGLFDIQGDVGVSSGAADGLFLDDARHLSRWELQIFDKPPLLLDSAVLDDDLAVAIDLSNPDLTETVGLAPHTVHVRRRSFMWNDVFYERLTIRNFDDEPQVVELSIQFGADFHDTFEIRGQPRDRRGSVESAVENGRVRYAYCGLDGVRRTTEISFDPPPERLSIGCAAWRLDLAVGAQASLACMVKCGNADKPAPRPARLPEAYKSARQERDALAASLRGIASSNVRFDAVLGRAAYDIAMLSTRTKEGPYPYGGVPWFNTVFGRDGLITAMQLLWLDPEIARGVLRMLADTQAQTYDASADAQPGKIVHELRRGEMARTGEVPFRRYYGSVDATPLFVLLAGSYLRRTGDLASIRAIWPNVEAALGWIDRDGDLDGDGFVEYQCDAAAGLQNQGWKDSGDSIFHADGTLAEGPVALCEVQAYVYAAKRAAADMVRKLGDVGRAEALQAQADRLRAAFEDVFWDEAMGCYVLALDGRKRPCRITASNAGHPLFCGIVSPERARRVAATLTDRAMFSGWGVRTIAAGQPRYNPMSYHNGSVWPHDTALIAAGFARYGLKSQALQLQEGVFAAAAYQHRDRLPELFCGFSRRTRRGPTAYPVACSPQAWAAAAPFGLLAAALGLEIDENGVRLSAPRLPAGVERLTISDLATPQGKVTLQFASTGDAVKVETPSRSTQVNVRVCD
jgi:glycogen debranching enzyme